MEKSKEHNFDLYVSLGGNCAAAAQLKKRNLRIFSLPFDYFFFKTQDEFNKVLNAFKNDFKNCFLKENLAELKGEERGTSNLFQYKDLISGYRIIHLFKEPINKKGAYKKYSSVIFKRLKRYYKKCAKAKSICYILSLNSEFDNSKYIDFLDILEEKNPNKNVKLIILNFDSDKDEIIYPKENLEVRNIKRGYNDYDFYFTNYEWSFLDDYKLTSNRKKYLYKVIKTKKELHISLFGYFNRVFQFKIYFLGFTFEFSFGRFKM